MVQRWDVTLPALTGNRPRKAYIYLPVGYGQDPERRYPVLYMFDGHNLFDDAEATYGKSWGLSDYLDYTRTPVVVAAVECNTEGNGRLEEYSPVDFTFRDGSPIKGKGKKYMDWLVNEWKPCVDAEYLTLPDRGNTAIAGSSMGGLMTMFALARYNRFFSKGAALSPSLWVGEGKAAEIVKGGRYAANTVLYTDYGSREFAGHRGQRELFAETCAALIDKKVLLTARVVPGGTHCEASWEKSIPFFMNALGFFPENEG